jgi:hypothetical protein
VPRLINIPLLVLLAVLSGAAAETTPTPKHVFDPVVVAMSTNPPGLYPLAKVWTGREKITFSDGPPEVGSPDRHFRFDTAQVLGDFRFALFDAKWWIGERDTNGLKPGTIHGYHPRLPSDAELATIRTDAAFSNHFHRALGLIQVPNFAAGVGFGSQHFTLGSNNTIETLRVYFYKNKPGTNIQGVTIRRAIIRREGVWWYP